MFLSAAEDPYFLPGWNQENVIFAGDGAKALYDSNGYWPHFSNLGEDGAPFAPGEAVMHIHRVQWPANTYRLSLFRGGHRLCPWSSFHWRMAGKRKQDGPSKSNPVYSTKSCLCARWEFIGFKKKFSITPAGRYPKRRFNTFPDVEIYQS